MAALLRFIVDIVVLSLVLLGLAGSAIKFIEPDGYLDHFAEYLFNLPIRLIIPALLAMAVLLWAIVRWADGKGTTRMADYMVYIFALLGIVLLLKWI